MTAGRRAALVALAGSVAWLSAAGTVAAYLPAMAIVGALVPVHRLLQQRPFQVFGGLLSGRQQPLQHQAGARAFDNFVRTRGVGKRVKNQGRKFIRRLAVLHGYLAR